MPNLMSYCSSKHTKFTDGKPRLKSKRRRNRGCFLPSIRATTYSYRADLKKVRVNPSYQMQV